MWPLHVTVCRVYCFSGSADVPDPMPCSYVPLHTRTLRMDACTYTQARTYPARTGHVHTPAIRPKRMAASLCRPRDVDAAVGARGGYRFADDRLSLDPEQADQLSFRGKLGLPRDYDCWSQVGGGRWHA